MTSIGAVEPWMASLGAVVGCMSGVLLGFILGTVRERWPRDWRDGAAAEEAAILRPDRKPRA